MSEFIDSNIPMYVAGRAHPHKGPAAEYFRRVARRGVDAVSDVEVLQEILHRYSHLGEREKGFHVFQAFLLTVPVIHPVLLEDMLEARDLLEHHRSLKPRDAVHAAVMIRRGIRTIVSYDRDFDGLPGIRRIEP